MAGRVGNIAHSGHQAVQAQAGDRSDFAERGGQFSGAVMRQALLEGLEGRLPRVAADAQDEREAEACTVGPVERVPVFCLVGFQPRQRKRALLCNRCIGHRAPAGVFTGQLRVSGIEGDACGLVQSGHHPEHRRVQRFDGRKRALVDDTLCHPWRMLPDVGQGSTKERGRAGVEVFQAGSCCHGNGSYGGNALPSITIFAVLHA